MVVAVFGPLVSITCQIGATCLLDAVQKRKERIGSKDEAAKE